MPMTFMNVLNRLLGATSRRVVTTGLSRGVSASGSILLALVYARAASLSEFGVFFAAQAVAATAMVPARLGLDYGSTRVIAPLYAAKLPRTIISWAVISTIPVLVASTVLAVVISLFGSSIADAFALPAMGSILPIMAISIVTIGMGEVVAGILRGFGVSQYSGMQTGGSSMAAATAIWVIYTLTGAVSLKQAAWCFVLSSAVVTGIGIALIFLVAARLPREDAPVRPDRTAIFEYYRASARLMIGHIFAAISQLLPAFFIGRMLTAEDLGLFRIAERLALAIGLVFIVVGDAFAARYAQLLNAGNIEEMSRTVRIGAAVPIAIAVPVIVLFLVFRDSLLGMLGPSYLAAGPVSAIMMTGMLLRSLFGPGSMVLIMGSKERAIAAAYFAAMLLALLLHPLLIGFFGLQGSALAWSITVAVQSGAQSYLAYRLLGISTLPLRFARRDGG